MQTIVWTCKEIEGQFQAMAISVSELFGFNVTFNSEDDVPEEYVKSFPTKEDACHHMTEINKPNYYDRYKLNYELVYVDAESPEWADAYVKYEKTLELAKGMSTLVQAPWYKRIFKRFFIRKMAREF